MTAGPGAEGPEPNMMPASVKPPWAQVSVVIAAVSGTALFVVNRWKDVEPVLESPAMIVMAMLAIFGLGGLSAYWLLARPHEERLRRAEAVINRLREHERLQMSRMAEKDVAIARLEERLNALQREFEEYKRDHAPARRPAKPKPPKA